MKVGDYVRTKYGIKQIYEIDNNKTVWKYKFKLKKQDGDGCVDLSCFSDNDVIKSSPNIIDLIEVGDYVNGYFIEDNKGNYLETSDIDGEYSYLGHIEYIKIYEKDIKSIVTREMFESMEYKIEEK